MKILVLAALSMSPAALAQSEQIADESFAATFSDYGELDKLLSCTPGFDGGYATPDTLSLSGGIDLGVDFYPVQFNASYDKAMSWEGHGERPYERGCAVAVAAFKKQIEGLKVVKLTMHRKTVRYPNTSSRALRDRSGEVLSVEYVTTDLYYESFHFDLAGLHFQDGRILTGKTRPN